MIAYRTYLHSLSNCRFQVLQMNLPVEYVIFNMFILSSCAFTIFVIRLLILQEKTAQSKRLVVTKAPEATWSPLVMSVCPSVCGQRV